jgi:hypothetical protein
VIRALYFHVALLTGMGFAFGIKALGATLLVLAIGCAVILLFEEKRRGN